MTGQILESVGSRLGPDTFRSEHYAAIDVL